MNNKSSFMTIIAPELLTFWLLLTNKYKYFWNYSEILTENIYSNKVQYKIIPSHSQIVK